MRIFLAGATGAIGRRLTPMLVEAGHDVVGATRTPQKAEALREMGAEPVVVDALDRQALIAAVVEAQPQTVIHMLTALPKRVDPRHIERDFAVNDRLREDGTRDLVAAAQRAGATRMIAQSVAFLYMPLAGIAGRPALRSEEDPLDFEGPKALARTVGALDMLEHTVLAADGMESVVLRFGYFYGPGTAIASDGAMVEDVHRRRLPIVGAGGAVWSFVHIDDAARAVRAALQAPRGIYNVVDDEPAPVREWLPELARTLGAPPPRRVPTLVARPLAGTAGVRMMTRGDGASNEHAKRALGWQPRIPSWREGFRTALG